MIKHLIIGRGNIGLDLEIEVARAGGVATVVSRSTGFDWRKNIDLIHQLDPNYIWITAGHGSILEAQSDPGGAYETSVGMPWEIMKSVNPSTCVCLFSTDYVANEQYPDNPLSHVNTVRSIYAMSKLAMENMALHVNRPLTSIVRVCSVYGQHFPLKTFPGKMIAGVGQITSLPPNMVTPSPSKWIARTLINNSHKLFKESGTTIHHCAPSGNVSTADWGRLILPDHEIKDRGFDFLRPLGSKLGCTLIEAPDWRELWDLYSIECLQAAQSRPNPYAY